MSLARYLASLLNSSGQVPDAKLVALTASKLTGQVPDANAPSGSVLQVVNATTTTMVSASTGTYIDTTLSASITPQFANSKILVLVNQAGCTKQIGDVTLQLKLLRNSTELIRFEASGGWTGTSGINSFGSCSTCYLDEPTSTSAITYKTQMASFAPNASVYTQFNVGAGAPASTITLMEVAG